MAQKFRIFKFKDFQFTRYGLILGAGLIFISHLFNVDYFEHLAEFLEKYDSIELDEYLIVVMLLVPAIFVDYLIIKNQKDLKQKLDQERYQVFRSTMTNVNHTFNNLLNQIQFFQIIASEHKVLTQADVAELEEIIRNAEIDILALNNLGSIPGELADQILPIRLR